MHICAISPAEPGNMRDLGKSKSLLAVILDRILLKVRIGLFSLLRRYFNHREGQED